MTFRAKQAILFVAFCWLYFRSLFDIHRNLKDSTQKPPQQVFVSCNYCGNSILTNMLSTGEVFILQYPYRSVPFRVENLDLGINHS